MIRDYKKRGSIPVSEDILPPHDEGAELSVLACLLEDAINGFEQIGADFNAGYFFIVRHQILFSVLKKMRDANAVIDITTFISALRDAGEFERAGGITWLTELTGRAVSIFSIAAYAAIVREKYLRRKAVQSCQKVVGWAMGEKPIIEIMSEAATLFEFDSPIDSPVLDGNQSGQKMIDDLERRFNLNGALAGLSTGFNKLDAISEGLQFGEQSIIGARPSMGKTALCVNIFKHNVFNCAVPSLFISLEMSVAALMRRMLSDFSNIPMNVIRHGTYTAEQFAKFSIFKAAAANAPMHILYGSMSISEIEYHVRRYVRLHGIRLVCLDYLQKVRSSIKQEKKTYEVGNVSERLKWLAEETGVAMLTMAQLNREPDKDKGRLPRLNDLADSGQIERDGDLIGLLSRDKMNPSDKDGLYICKQRDGELGFVPLDFDGPYCRFKTKYFGNEEPEPTAPVQQPLPEEATFSYP